MARTRSPWMFLVVILLTAITAYAEIPKQLVQARQLILLGRFDQALTLVESVTPDGEDGWALRESLLRDIYESQKNYAALEHLVYQALTRRPDRPDRTEWLFLRAELNLKGERIDSARSLLDSLWRADPTDLTVTRTAELYLQHALADWAQATYLDARAAMGDSTRYAFQLAVLYESRRDYARATSEYFRAMERDTLMARGVENRILQLVQTAESRTAIEAELEKAAITEPSAVSARRLQIALYLETGRPDDAWRAAWIADSLLNQQGLSLITFMRQASERGYYAVASQAARRILETYPSSPVRHQAEWELARLAARSGNAETALDRYARMATDSPVLRFRMEAALAAARLLARDFFRLDEADSVYASVTSAQSAGLYHDQALLGRAWVASARGDVEGAQSLLSRLASRASHQSVREELAFRLAEVAFFAGDIEQAKETWNALVSDYPKGVWVNDALRYVMLLTAYGEIATADVKRLAEAEALGRRRQYDSALTRISGIRTNASAPLAPRATLASAEYHRDAGRPDSALAILEHFVTNFADEADAPYALMQAGWILKGDLNRPEQARDRFRQLLEAYPRSHWAEEARRNLRSYDQL